MVKKIAGEIALSVGIALVMGTLSGLGRCLDTWDAIKHRL